MNHVQRSLTRHVQSGSIEITGSSGTTYEFPLAAARRTTITAGPDGNPQRIDANWTRGEAIRFVRNYERWLYLGWLRRVPLLRRWAPSRPMTGDTRISDLEVRAPSGGGPAVYVKGRLDNVAISGIVATNDGMRFAA